jgi:hypothetical protein
MLKNLAIFTKEFKFLSWEDFSVEKMKVLQENASLFLPKTFD